MKHSGVILALLAIVSLVLVSATCVIAGLVVCDSSTDGNGLFTYTFTNDPNESFVFGLKSNEGYLAIQSYGIEDVVVPEDWTYSVGSDGYVEFRYTNGTWFIEDVPVTFQIQSHFTRTVTYTNGSAVKEFFRGGWVTGGIYTPSPDHTKQASAGDEYDIAGPRPEPQFDGQSFSNATREMSIQLSDLAGQTCIVQYATWPTGPGWQTITNFPITSYTTNFVYTVPTGTNFGYLKYECVK